MVPTRIGCITAFDPSAALIHQGKHSLRFDPDGNPVSLRTVEDALTVHEQRVCPQKTETEIQPLSLTFRPDSVFAEGDVTMEFPNDAPIVVRRFADLLDGKRHLRCLA
jgi:hypothetical protein